MPYNLRLSSYLSIAIALFGVFFLLPQEESPIQVSNSYPSSILGASVQKYWSQTSFTGGINQGPYTIPFNNGSGGWSSYTSSTNTTIDGSGVKSADGNTGELISSIFDQGNYRSKVVGAYNDGYYSVISVRGANSPDGVLSAAWSAKSGTESGNCPIPYRYLQYKVTLPIDQYLTATPINKVAFTGQLQIISGFVTNSKTGAGINGVKVTVDGSSFVTETRPGDNKPGYYSIPIGFITDGIASLTTSYSGYKSVSKDFNTNIDNNGCSKDIEGNVSIDKIVTNPTAQTSSESIQTKVPDINKTVLPTVFTQNGSSTTDLSKITDIKNVSDFTLEIPGKNKIKFKDTVDLSSNSAGTVLSELDKYVMAKTTAVVEIDSSKAPFLNKRASIVMYNLTFDSTPKILVDSKINPEVVDNIQYKDKTLSFDASHFTKFEAVASTTVTNSSKQTSTSNNLIIALGLFVTSALVFVFGLLAYMRKKKQINPTSI